jgi:hypothetical protein
MGEFPSKLIALPPVNYGYIISVGGDPFRRIVIYLCFECQAGQGIRNKTLKLCHFAKTLNQRVQGSSPCAPTNHVNALPYGFGENESVVTRYADKARSCFKLARSTAPLPQIFQHQTCAKCGR